MTLDYPTTRRTVNWKHADAMKVGGDTAPTNVSEGDLTVEKRLTLSPSTAQNITAVGATISANASLVMLTGDNSYTLTSTPTIAAGADGQVLIIMNVDSADVFTLQDETALAGSNLRFAGAASLALGPRDVVSLIYSATLADWIEVFRSNN